MANITLRRAEPGDLQNIIAVEAGATPKLRYLERVFDEFLSDSRGAFIVAEVDGHLAGCGKFTVMSDDSAWLEALRVLPHYQGMGIGKYFYRIFFDIAHDTQITTLRMYTGVKNAVSKGLAERFGFRVSATYRGAWLPCQPEHRPEDPGCFHKVSDPDRATAILMPLRDKWTGYLVMNRTFFAITPELCRHLAELGQVYEDPETGSVVVLGARFMPDQALHVGLFDGDADACLQFAAWMGAGISTERISCLFPPSEKDLQAHLTHCGFQFEASDFLVLEVHC